MQDYLIVVDMQNDFISGALGSAEAQAIVAKAAEKIRAFSGKVIFTRDTHHADYLSTQEGHMLPVAHCIAQSDGWRICPELAPLAEGAAVIDKPSFGSTALGERLAAENRAQEISSITLIGLCTDICVISNALLLKAFLPEVPIHVDAACCAGVTPESHKNALAAMRACQIIVDNAE